MVSFHTPHLLIILCTSLLVKDFFNLLETYHLVIQSNTTLTPDVIDKLKYYAIKAIKIYVTEDGARDSPGFLSNEPEPIFVPPAPDLNSPTYFEKIQETEEFIEFKKCFTESVENFIRN